MGQSSELEDNILRACISAFEVLKQQFLQNKGLDGGQDSTRTTLGNKHT